MIIRLNNFDIDNALTVYGEYNNKLIAIGLVTGTRDNFFSEKIINMLQ